MGFLFISPSPLLWFVITLPTVDQGQCACIVGKSRPNLPKIGRNYGCNLHNLAVK